MLPESDETLLYADFTQEEPPTSRSYRISGNRIFGFVEGEEAVRQAVELILSCERFRHGIYSWDYGLELEDLFGLPLDLLYARLEGRIEEALMADDRIVGVEDFLLTPCGGRVMASFTVKTVFGEVRAQADLAIEEGYRV